VKAKRHRLPALAPVNHQDQRQLTLTSFPIVTTAAHFENGLEAPPPNTDQPLALPALEGLKPCQGRSTRKQGLWLSTDRQV
jgi:hypothetical protein